MVYFLLFVEHEKNKNHFNGKILKNRIHTLSKDEKENLKTDKKSKKENNLSFFLIFENHFLIFIIYI